jgi:adenosylcobinamide-GDP ribazoletransferase
VRAVVAAFAFLTRLPIGVRSPTVTDLGRSVAFFPVVGLALGLVLAGAALLLGTGLTPLIVAVLLVALLAGMTGGLHLVGGGRGNRARMLEIMRDSRIGAHGAAALVLLLIAKVLALAHALERRDLVPIVAFPALARWAVAPVIAFLPYARPEGLGRAFTSAARPLDVLIATGLMAASAAALGPKGLLRPAAATLAVMVVLALWLRRRLGGMTGDVYGAAIEIAETAALITASAS